MQIKQTIYDCNGFTFIDHENKLVSIPGNGGRFLEFNNSTLETVTNFYLGLKEFLIHKGVVEVPTPPQYDPCEDCYKENFDDSDEVSEAVTITCELDEEGYFPFEVALVAMRDGMKVREKNREENEYIYMNDKKELKFSGVDGIDCLEKMINGLRCITEPEVNVVAPQKKKAPAKKPAPKKK